MTKKLLVLLPLVAVVGMQLVRIEYVVANEPQPTPVADALVARATGHEVLPPYVIEPPDVLLINAIKLVPKPPHKIEPLDALLVRVMGTLPDHPIADAFAVDPDGKIDLGPPYGRVEVAGLTVDEARSRISRQLAKLLQGPEVSVSLAFSAGAQQIQGKHLVGPDGRVNLGIYGTVYVNGMTIDEARTAIERRLAEYLRDPQVVVDVSQYNSKKYYVITQNTNGGDNVAVAPITGNDTVLDALTTVHSVPQRTNKIWVSRPAPNGVGLEQILPVDWDALSKGKSTATNYRLRPGDRVFVEDTRQAQIEPARKYQFEIDLIEDSTRALAEFDTTGGDGPFNAFDSDTIRPALRILAKHDLIKRLSSPKLTCFEGQTATLETNPAGTGKSPTDGLRLHLSAREFDNLLMVQLGLSKKFEGKLYEFNSSIPAKLGETVLIRLNADDRGSASQDAVPLYVALTPSMVRDAPPQNFAPSNRPSSTSTPAK